MRNVIFTIFLCVLTLLISCHTNHKKDMYTLHLFSMNDDKYHKDTTARLDVEKRVSQDDIHFVYKSNLDMYGRMDTFRYFIKTGSMLYNRSFDVLFNDSLDIKTVCEFISSKDYSINKKVYKVLKYNFLDMNVYWSEDYDFLLEFDYWRGLSIECDDISKALVDSILNDKSAFSDIPDPNLIPIPEISSGL